jgi:hypothetical protein
MSAIQPTAVVTKPVGWAKANPWIFVIVLFILAIIMFRFREAIARGFAKMATWPIVGRPIAFLTGVQQNNSPPPAAAP